MHRTLIFALAMVAAAAVAAPAQPEDDFQGNQILCPVMGGEINPDVYVDYDGQRIFFCCAGCSGTFSSDPATYLERMRAAGVRPMRLRPQSICPVSGEELTNRETYAETGGLRVYFCCPACVAAFESDSDRYLRVLSERGETPETLDEEESGAAGRRPR